MKGLFWLGVGLAVGVYATRRITVAAQRLTPAGVGSNLAEGVRELGASLGAFGAEVRAGMDTRERELADLVERRTGAAVPTLAQAASGQAPFVYDLAPTGPVDGRPSRRGGKPAAGRSGSRSPRPELGADVGDSRADGADGAGRRAVARRARAPRAGA